MGRLRAVGIGVVVAAVVAGSAYWFWPKGPKAGPEAMTAKEWTTDGACGLLTAHEVRSYVSHPSRPGRGPRAVERSVRVDKGRDGETVIESCTFDTYWAAGPVTVQVRHGDTPQRTGRPIPDLGDYAWHDDLGSAELVAVQRGDILLSVEVPDDDAVASGTEALARDAYSRLPAEATFDRFDDGRCRAFRREAVALMPNETVYGRSLRTEQEEVCSYTTASDKDAVTVRLDRRPSSARHLVGPELGTVGGLRTISGRNGLAVLGDRRLVIQHEKGRDDRGLRRLAAAAIEEFGLRPPPPVTGRGACALLAPKEAVTLAREPSRYEDSVITASAIERDVDTCRYGQDDYGATVSLHSSPSRKPARAGPGDKVVRIHGRRAVLRPYAAHCEIIVPDDRFDLRITSPVGDCANGADLERVARSAYDRLKQASPVKDIDATGPCTKIDLRRLGTLLGGEIRYARTLDQGPDHLCTFTAAGGRVVRVQVVPYPLDTDDDNWTEKSDLKIGNDIYTSGPSDSDDAIDVFGESGNLHLYAGTDDVLDKGWDSWKRAERVAIIELMADSLL